MLASEIATRVKRQFGDEAGAQIKDEDIVRWINDAQREIAVNNDLMQTVATAPTAVGTNEYTLPTDILTLRTIYLGTRKLVGLSTQEAAEWDARESPATGEPTHYWIWGAKIRVYPTPTAIGSLKIYYTKQPTEVVAVGNTPELPQQYHNRIVEYCIAQAYELDDNFESYQSKMQQFQDGMDRLRGNDTFEQQDVYPSITVSAADCGAVDWDPYYG